MSDEKTPWEKYLEKGSKRETSKKPATLLDIFNRNNYLKDESIVKERLSICEGCEFLIHATHQCKKCGCFMKVKTKLVNAQCPLGKW